MLLRQTSHTPGPANHPAHSRPRLPRQGPALAVCLGLALAVWAVFGQTLRHEFVNYDDDVYVYENANVRGGLTWAGVLRTFTQFDVDEWWPLTTLSHMLDCELHGLNPAGHHLTNVLLHALAAVLLFLVLRNLTGAFWRSAFVAAAFALHPLRVESVAWVTERKDVLSGVFFVLTLGAYARYARRPFAAGRYLLALFVFLLALLSKATVITLPFVLLLLDDWPLSRVASGKVQIPREVPSAPTPRPPASSHRRLLLEKVPFLLLAVAGSLTTLLAVGEVDSLERLNLRWRLANALVAYATYLKQTVYPVGLAVFYPHPEDRLPLGAVAVSALILIALSAGVWAARRSRPYLLVGWLWYLIMLGPVIGLVQVGAQAHADRYTYLPHIGLYLMITWAVADWAGARRWRRALLAPAAGAALVGCMLLARSQTQHWRDSVSLWTHALACTSGNYLAHHNLGATLADAGRLDDAIAHYAQALALKPAHAEAHYNWGVALASQGRSEEAISHYEQALRFKPDHVHARVNLGNALAGQGRLTEALAYYEQALILKPNLAEAHFNLANALVKLGRVDDAIRHYQRATELRPDYFEAHYNLGNRLAAQGRWDEAIQSYERALRIKPDQAEVHNNLGNRLAAQRKWDQAAHHYRRALQLKPDDAEAHNNLGVALSNQERWDEAVACYEQALRIEPAYAAAHANLANALHRQGRSPQALEHWHEALRHATAQTNTALVQAILKRLESFPSPPASPSP